jgi:hypothetical protein
VDVLVYPVATASKFEASSAFDAPIFGLATIQPAGGLMQAAPSNCRRGDGRRGHAVIRCCRYQGYKQLI